jgi:hypothetical protein
MRTKLRSRMSLLFVAVAALIAIPAAVALADDVFNNLDGSIDATVETTRVNTGANTSVGFKIKPITGDDGVNGCNVKGTGTLVANVTSSAPGKASVSPSQVTFENCDDTETVTVTGVSAGDATISLSEFSNNTGGTFNFAPATFKVTVTDPAPPADTTAPTIGYTITGTLGNNDWYRSDVTLVWNVTDPESTVTKTGCVDETITSDQAATTYSCSASSAGGNAGPVTVSIKRDATDPTISGSAAPPANGNGWNNTNVVVSYICGDNLSGVASCGPNATLVEGANQSSTGTAVDNAGNSDTATVSGINVDKTDPVVSVTGVANGATYTLGSVPPAGCNTTDALSDVATNATLEPLSGGPVGSITATCSGAVDNADNPGSASVTYNVIFNWTGFFQPVDNLPTLNSVKAGSAVPVKFSLSGNQGLDIFDTGYPKSEVIACSSTAPVDGIESTVTAGNSSLSYDASSDQYNYVWKTEKSWAGQCRQLVVKLDDGTFHRANFKLLK